MCEDIVKMIEEEKLILIVRTRQEKNGYRLCEKIYGNFTKGAIK